MFRILLFALLVPLLAVQAQFGREPVRIFGYFQNTFEMSNAGKDDRDRGPYNSFLLQQLNLFLQRDIDDHWRAFVNFEVLNSYSSSRGWGAFNLEEAWVSYRHDNTFTLKLGLQIPIFNQLNTIKNRTPLLPYIIRPLVYESSFNEFISLDEFAPSRAFIQAYGFIPIGRGKIDYAAYVGNGPDINGQSENGQTAIDTTTHFLVGGRLGFRHGDVTAGMSVSHEKTNLFESLAPLFNRPIEEFRDLHRVRLGADVQIHGTDFILEGEWIEVLYEEGSEDVENDKRFFYLTGGWRATETLMLYASYWQTAEEYSIGIPLFGDIRDYEAQVRVPTGGLSWNFSERITFKLQYAYVELDGGEALFFPAHAFNMYTTAVSVFF